MKTCYRYLGTRAVIDLTFNEIYYCWSVSKVYVPPSLRWKGIGGALLAHVCADADEEGSPLVLVVQPEGGRKALVYGELVRWYERHGFKPCVAEEDTGIMYRRPKRQKL